MGLFLDLSLSISSLLPFPLPNIFMLGPEHPRSLLLLITSFHFNSAELGASELKRKFTQIPDKLNVLAFQKYG